MNSWMYNTSEYADRGALKSEQIVRISENAIPLFLNGRKGGGGEVVEIYSI